MRIIVHHSKFYDWEPVPRDVEVTPEDVAAGRVKPGARAGDYYLMRVVKEPEGGTYTEIRLPEHQILEKIIEDAIKRNQRLTRRQAVALYVSEHVLPHHAHRSWVTGVEVHDDGPSKDLAAAKLDEHVAAGNIDAADHAAHLAAYLETADGAAHTKHLSDHFKLSKKKPS